MTVNNLNPTLIEVFEKQIRENKLPESAELMLFRLGLTPSDFADVSSGMKLSDKLSKVLLSDENAPTGGVAPADMSVDALTASFNKQLNQYAKEECGLEPAKLTLEKTGQTRDLSGHGGGIYNVLYEGKVVKDQYGDPIKMDLGQWNLGFRSADDVAKALEIGKAAVFEVAVQEFGLEPISSISVPDMPHDALTASFNKQLNQYAKEECGLEPAKLTLEKTGQTRDLSGHGGGIYSVLYEGKVVKDDNGNPIKMDLGQWNLGFQSARDVAQALEIGEAALYKVAERILGLE